jgi:hypothetical protein
VASTSHQRYSGYEESQLQYPKDFSRIAASSWLHGQIQAKAAAPLCS